MYVCMYVCMYEVVMYVTFEGKVRIFIFTLLQECIINKCYGEPGNRGDQVNFMIKMSVYP